MISLFYPQTGLTHEATHTSNDGTYFSVYPFHYRLQRLKNILAIICHAKFPQQEEKISL